MNKDWINLCDVCLSNEIHAITVKTMNKRTDKFYFYVLSKTISLQNSNFSGLMLYHLNFKHCKAVFVGHSVYIYN